MKRQAIAVGLKDLVFLKKRIMNEIKSIKKLGVLKGDNIRVLLPIVNFPVTQKGEKGEIYCADTWQFEDLIPKSRKFGKKQ